MDLKPDEFVRITRPIFDEHEADGDGDIDVSPEMLQNIIDAFWQRVQRTGDYPVVTLGHTVDSDNPNVQPPVVGFATRFDMGELPDGSAAIIGTFDIFKDRYEEARRNPRVSVELWTDMVVDPIALLPPEKHPIDVIALLGAERPARDLGLHFQKYKNGAKYLYSFFSGEKIMADMPDDKDKIKCDEADAEKDPEVKKSKKYEEDDDEEDDNSEDAQRQAEDDQIANAKIRHQFDQYKRKYAKLEQEVAHYKAKVEAMEAKATLAERKNDLMQLEAEGYQFDMGDELDTVKDLEPARYQKHLSSIKKNYKQAPVNMDFGKAAVMPEQPRNERISEMDVYKKAGISQFSKSNLIVDQIGGK